MKRIDTSYGLNVLLLAVSVLASRTMSAQTRSIDPVLAFPEQGLDDSAAYQGYQTRFYRDAAGNVVQVYLDARTGRAVSVLADALNESVGFTVRDGAGKPLRLKWGAERTVISRVGARRSIEYQLEANVPLVQLGWILLGSMRVERDLVYSGRHLQPFASPTFRLPEVEEMIANIARLDQPERARHLLLLNAGGLAELRQRLEPTLTSPAGSLHERLGFKQASIDGKTHLQLDLAVDPAVATIEGNGPTVSIRSKSGKTVRFSVRVTTDAPSLTPLARGQIFNSDFLRFVDGARAATNGGADSSATSRYRQLERDVRSVELLSAKEKLMAGMPNYATYFGRDMMMTALMMQPIWSSAMSEHVIASVLRKLGPEGDVSHEEALGGQAIRENASEYNRRLIEYFAARAGDGTRASGALSSARALLGNLQRVRENYSMRDDEFQLPVLAALYLGNKSVTASRKIAFLMDSSDGRGPRIRLLLRELGLVTSLAAPYARDPVPTNLVGAPITDSVHWRPVSWRDSGAGYANGRFAMDINAIWVPRALEATEQILFALKSLGFSGDRLAAIAPEMGKSPLAVYARDTAAIRHAVETWKGAVKYFVVSLRADEVHSMVESRLGSMPPEDASFWRGVLASSGADRQPLEFLAISLDADGRPVKVVNTDPATWLFLHDTASSKGMATTSAAAAATRERAIRDVRAFMRAYPVGLFVEGLGTLVANDAYASPAVWEAFQKDTYHSPRVVWGREVNLIMLGLAREISASIDESGRPRDPSLGPYVQELRDALQRTTSAVETSGLKHNELWSYEIAGGRLVPIRYGASTDIQLWNVTSLAVQFVLSRLAR